MTGRGRPRRPSPIRDAVLAHPCTHCGAQPGDACRAPSGVTGTPHGARFAAAAAAKAAAETTTEPEETP